MLLDPYMPENYKDPQVWAFWNEDEYEPTPSDALFEANIMRLRAGLDHLPVSPLLSESVPRANGTETMQRVGCQQSGCGCGSHSSDVVPPRPCTTNATTSNVTTACGGFFFTPYYTEQDIPF